jgi:hypothetical protein
MDELRPGLWTWTAPHPAWTPDEGGPDGWAQDVRSYALVEGNELIFLDPLSPPTELQRHGRGRTVAVLLTVRWHQRSAPELAERLRASVHCPAAGVDNVQTAAIAYRPGDSLPGGIEAKATAYPEEAVLWIPAHGALVTGDVLIPGPEGLQAQPDSWLAGGVTREGLRDSLRPLLHLPIELLLPTHGDPAVEGAQQVLERALAA